MVLAELKTQIHSLWFASLPSDPQQSIQQWICSSRVELTEGQRSPETTTAAPARPPLAPPCTANPVHRDRRVGGLSQREGPHRPPASGHRPPATGASRGDHETPTATSDHNCETWRGTQPVSWPIDRKNGMARKTSQFTSTVRAPHLRHNRESESAGSCSHKSEKHDSELHQEFADLSCFRFKTPTGISMNV